jgi:hypothetical protein
MNTEVISKLLQKLTGVVREAHRSGFTKLEKNTEEMTYAH